MERLGGTLVALYPEAVDRVHVTLVGGDTLHRGQDATLEVRVLGRSGKALPGTQPLEVTVFTPQGEWPEVTGRTRRRMASGRPRSDRRSMIRLARGRFACGSYRRAQQRKSLSKFNNTCGEWRRMPLKLHLRMQASNNNLPDINKASGLVIYNHSESAAAFVVHSGGSLKTAKRPIKGTILVRDFMLLPGRANVRSQQTYGRDETCRKSTHR